MIKTILKEVFILLFVIFLLYIAVKLMTNNPLGGFVLLLIAGGYYYIKLYTDYYNHKNN